MDEQQQEQQQFFDYWTYLKNIDWTDPWLIGLITLHLATTSTTYLMRNYGGLQIVLFLLLLSLVYFSETINHFAAQHWRTFSREQYFDSDGLFISTVFSIPILLNCMLLIGTWLYGSTQLMATMKAAQLQQMLRKRQQQQQQQQQEQVVQPPEQCSENNGGDNDEQQQESSSVEPAVIDPNAHVKQD